MARAERHKCKCCHKLFRPEPRNRYHQRYCAAPSCRAASKAASQARWLAAPENRDYFRGPVNVARVRAWRARHPSYWRKRVVLQDLSLEQATDSANKKANFEILPLPEILLAQPAVLIGLIAILRAHRYKMRSPVPPTVCYGWAKTFSLPRRLGPMTEPAARPFLSYHRMLTELQFTIS